MYLDAKPSAGPFRDYKVRRREPRYVACLPIALQRFTCHGPYIIRGVSLDISLGGVSALVCGTPAIGESVVIELKLPTAIIDVPATVRYTTDEKSGLEFCGVSEVVSAALRDLIKELRKPEEKMFPYPYAPTPY